MTEKKNRKHGKTLKRILKGILLAVCGFIGAALLTVCIFWGNEILTFLSIRQIAESDGKTGYGTYEIHVSGDYYFDEFLEQGGASTVQETKDFLTDHLTKGLLEMVLIEPDAGCSAFAAPLENGDRIVARNYDMRPTKTAVVYTKSGKGKHASIANADLSFVGISSYSEKLSVEDRLLCLAAPYMIVDGMNDAGVSISILVSGQRRSTNQCTDKPDLLCTVMMRLVLDYADDVEEAIELIRQYDIHDANLNTFHYLVADAEGRSAVIEFIDPSGKSETDRTPDTRELQVIRQNDTGTQAVSNYILLPDYYSENEKRHGVENVAIMEETLAAGDHAVTDEQAAMDIMESVSKKGMGVSGISGVTVHSVIYNLTEKTALWIGSEHYGEKAYTRTFQLK